MKLLNLLEEDSGGKVQHIAGKFILKYSLLLGDFFVQLLAECTEVQTDKINKYFDQFSKLLVINIQTYSHVGDFGGFNWKHGSKSSPECCTGLYSCKIASGISGKNNLNFFKPENSHFLLGRGRHSIGSWYFVDTVEWLSCAFQLIDFNR